MKSKAVLTLVISIALTTIAAQDHNRGSDRFHVSVVDVVDETSTIVKQIRNHAKPGTVATIASDRKGGGGVSASAGSQPDQPDHGIVTILVFADHVDWEAGNVNAMKFLMSASSNGSKASMSDTGPMIAGECSTICSS